VLKLLGAARLASWPTPAVTNADRGGDARRFKGEQSQVGRRSNLQDAVMTASWPTPVASDCGGQESHNRTWSVTQCNLHNVALGRGKQMDGRVFERETAPAATLVGWPTPRASEADKGVRTHDGAKNEFDRCAGVRGADLQSTAVLASWATPAAREAGGTPEQFLARKRKAVAKGSQLGVSLTSLQLQAQLASWATPAARDHRSDRGRKSDSEQYGSKGRPLPRQALLLDSGQTPSGGSAATEKYGQLNPAHSLWLLGFPAEWLWCAPESKPQKPVGTTPLVRSKASATRSSRR
jgi:hypothetical protein